MRSLSAPGGLTSWPCRLVVRTPWGARSAPAPAGPEGPGLSWGQRRWRRACPRPLPSGALETLRTSSTSNRGKAPGAPSCRDYPLSLWEEEPEACPPRACLPSPQPKMSVEGEGWHIYATSHNGQRPSRYHKAAVLYPLARNHLEILWFGGKAKGKAACTVLFQKDVSQLVCGTNRSGRV